MTSRILSFLLPQILLTGQAALAAGPGGFDITVANHTELIGAAITSLRARVIQNVTPRVGPPPMN
ncbi:MAG: hypothetical protein LBE33_01715 [Zoogloeaceae bacterium]|nr:hypothetical protein [Zoogloeaceae bacterium]